MREIVERFVGRYQIWRAAQAPDRANPPKNPYVFFALVAAAFLLWDIYKLVTGVQVPWYSLVANGLFLAFLILCVWKPRWAWIVFLVLGVTMVVESPWVYTLNRYRQPAQARFVAALFYAALGIVVLAYGFVIRRRYQTYEQYRADNRSI